MVKTTISVVFLLWNKGKGKMKNLRRVIGYSILTCCILFMLIWDGTVLAIYGVIGFHSFLELVQVLGFIALSFLTIAFVDYICSKILPQGSLTLKEMIKDAFK